MAGPQEKAAPLALATTRVDAQQLIAQAIDKGASIDTMERLVALAKDIRVEMAREAWYNAMAEFQHTCPPIKKTASARIPTGAGGGYSYQYAPLDEIMATIQPVMGPLGLSVSWRTRVDPQSVVVSCRVAHRLGHTEDSGEIAMPIGAGDRGGANPAQRVAIATTYAKRYSLLGIIGMAPEDDDDASGLHERPPARPRPATREDMTEAERKASVLDQEEVEERDRNTSADTLFPTDEEEAERGRLIVDASRLAKKLNLNAKERLTALQTYGGNGATPQNIDLAALAELVNFLRARAGEPKWGAAA